MGIAGGAELGEVGGEASGDGGFGLEADEMINELAILEDEQSGNAGDVECGGRAGVFVDIELGDEVLAGGLGGQLLDGRGDLAAGTTPRSPAVDKKRSRAGGGKSGGEDLIREGEGLG